MNRTTATPSIGSAELGRTQFSQALRERALELFKGTQNPSDALANIGQTIAAQEEWDAYQFIDWCQAAEGDSDSDVTRFLQQVQAEEIKLLLAYSYRNAV